MNEFLTGDSVKWQMPSLPMRFLNNEVHILMSSFTENENNVKFLEKVLSDGEKERACRFVFNKDRFQYIIARGLLRILISRYNDTAPEDLIFSYNKHGKPSFDVASIWGSLEFNVAHSGDLILYTVTLNRKVGIDIELIRPIDDVESIIESSFTDKEKSEFKLIPEYDKNHAFFTTWVCKEAYAKAHGKGITLPFNEFYISMKSPESIMISRDENSSNGSDWLIKNFSPADGYTAAVAVQGEEVEFKFWQLLL